MGCSLFFHQLYSMQPGFDSWTILFLFFASLAMLFSIFFMARFKTQGASVYISIIVFLFAITLFDWVLYWTHYQFFFPHLINLWLTFCFAYGPLAFFYLKNFSGKPLSTFQKLIHLSSFLVVLAYNLFFLCMSTQQKQEIIVHGFSSDSIHRYLWDLIDLLSLIHICIYSFACWRETIKFVSLTSVKNWSMLFTSMFSLFVLNYLIYYFLSKTSFFNKDWDYGIGFSMLLFIAALVYTAYAQPDIFNGYPFKESFLGKTDLDKPIQSDSPEEANPLHEKKGEKKYKNSPLSQEISVGLIQQLNTLMANEKYYLHSEISLAFLSEKMNLSRHHTSQLINEQLGVSFFEYIKTLRIEEAKRILSNKKEPHKIIDVAYMVGFNNKVSFFTAFKEKTGMTPSEFVKMVSEQG
ncbi:MAG: helix-turn-helix domain-containing protein [Bacteroidia bacterium]